MINFAGANMWRTGAAAFVAAIMASAALAQEAPMHVRGQVEASDGSTLTVKSREGETVKIMMHDKTRISGLTKADLASVKEGTYIGTAAVPQPDGTLVAQELLIFPPAMKGVGEGHRPWDLTADSTMTNATVESIVSEVKGRKLKVAYKGGEKTVLVPPEAPVVTIVGADKAELKPGAHIFAVAEKQPDGSLSAVRVSVGKEGLVPPM